MRNQKGVKIFLIILRTKRSNDLYILLAMFQINLVISAF